MTEEQVFLAALDLPDRANRTAYLDEACADNSVLRRQVEQLLAAHERSGQFLDEPAAEQMAAGTQPPIVQTIALNDEGDDAMADCKSLTHLNLGGTKVTGAGLIYFKACKRLNKLILDGTKLTDADLATLKGMPLNFLSIYNTGVTDLTPLQGMPLEVIHLTPKNITRGLDTLRDMKSLKTIGIGGNQSWPAGEFWERYDKGEFKE